MSQPPRQSSTIPPTPAPRRRRPETRRGVPPFAVLGVAVVALVLAAGLAVAGDVFRSGGASTEPQAAARPPEPGSGASGNTATGPAGPRPVTPPVRDGQSKGSKDATVVIVEYADFQCPYCAQAARSPIKQVEQAYVATGKVRLIFRQFPFIGNESVMAAMASECAGEQGKFWEYHDKLFANQNGENKGAFAKEKLQGFAQDLGVEMASFNDCVDSNRYLDKIKQDFDEGRRQGVESTPTFLVNDQRLLGAQPFDVFRTAIEQELQKKQ